MKRPVVALVAVLFAMGVSNLVASWMLDLGDAEALYYCYSRHLSLSFLDHPPLVGALIRLSTAIAGSTAMGVRLVPMAMTGLCLLFSYLCAKEMFGDKAGAYCVLLLFVSPVFSIGMIAASPDAPLAALVMLYTWQMHRALSAPQSRLLQTALRSVLLGATVGLAFLAKYTGACLVLSTLILLLQKDNRLYLKRSGFYLGTVIALLCAAPVFGWNYTHDWMGVLHRLAYTQTEAGFTFRNLGALIGGQLLYVGPLVMVLFGLAIKNHVNIRKTSLPENRARRLLMTVSLPALTLTYLLVCWSKTAEPHWPAAGYLPLYPLAAGYIAEAGLKVRRLFQWTAGFGVAVFFIAHVVVLSPLVPALVPKPFYEPKYDLANELRGWDEVAQIIRQNNPGNKPVVAAFYTQCSQLAFHLSRPGDPEVRCVSPELDDFDIWYGSFSLNPNGAVFVTDNRFMQKVEDYIENAKVQSRIVHTIKRGNTEVRRFEIVTVVPKTISAKTVRAFP